MNHHSHNDDWIRRSRRPRGTGERLRDWLRARPTESWAFFAAGFVLAAILT